MEDLVEFPLKCFNSLGFLVANPNRKTTTKLLISEFMFAFSVIIPILNYFYANGIDEFIDNQQCNGVWFIVFANVNYCIYYKTEFLILIEKRKSFWDTSNCSTDTKRNISWISNVVKFLQKAFIYQCLGVALAFTSIAILRKTLPFGVLYISVRPVTYFIVWVTNAFSCFLCSVAEVSFPVLFIGLCYEVIAQFKILYDHLERLDVENIDSEEELQDFVDKFKFYSKHHKFLLRYVQDIKDGFSILYLIQYLVTAPVCCVSMYVALESHIFTRKLVSIVTCLNVILQLAFYCIPATYMTDEVPKIATAIYNSKWYGKHFNKLKKSTQLKIQDAQQEIRMTCLGGMIDINSKTLITIVRTSFSVCTVLQNLKKLKENQNLQ